MSEWSHKLSEHIKLQMAEKSNQNSVFLEHQRLKKAFGPSLWHNLIKEVKNHCDDLNRDMGRDVAIVESESSSWLNVRDAAFHDSNGLRVTFNQEQCRLQWRTDVDSKPKEYEVSIGDGGRAAFYRLNETGDLGATPSSPQNIAKEMLNNLFFMCDMSK